MTDYTPKLTAINQILYTINNNIAIIDNYTKIIDKSNTKVMLLKRKKNITLKEKQTIYAELYKIHKLKLNSFNSIQTIKKQNNIFKEKFNLTGGSTTIIEEPLIEKRKKSMKDFLTFKSYLEIEQQKYSIL